MRTIIKLATGALRLAALAQRASPRPPRPSDKSTATPPARRAHFVSLRSLSGRVRGHPGQA
ncbi:hypothetical protein, partial [Microbacterium foliorum]|uniref:hypothetical protein n=1 Tax=Microbacterium foliorum TaxID=104336 RepID=UPI001AD82AA6